MKKIWALILLGLYAFSSNACFAFSELHYVKNVKKATLIPQIEEIFKEYEYDIKQKNSTYAAYAVSVDDIEKYATVVLQQSGDNLFYYFESDKSSKKLNKKFLKSLDKQNFIYEESTSQMHLENFAKIAQKTEAGATTKYSFDETKQVYTQQQPSYSSQSSSSSIPSKSQQQNVGNYQQPQNVVQSPQQSNIAQVVPPYNNVQQQPSSVVQTQQPQTMLKGYVGRVPSGTKIDAYIQNPINTATAQVGDQVIAVVKSDWTYNNSVIAPQGSVIYGKLSKANKAAMGSRNGAVEIEFNQLATPYGQTYELATEKIDFKVTNDGKLERTVKKVLAGAVVGSLVGLAFAAISGDASLLKSSLISAGIAGGTALASSAIEHGVDAEIPSFTEIEIVLDKPFNVMMSY